MFKLTKKSINIFRTSLQIHNTFTDFCMRWYFLIVIIENLNMFLFDESLYSNLILCSLKHVNTKTLISNSRTR